MQKKLDIKKIIIIVVCIILLGILIIWYVNQKKLKNIVVDIDTGNSYNIRMVMAPAYSTVIYGGENSIVKLVSTVYPQKKLNKKIEWVVSDSCASVDSENKLVVKSDCEFSVYAKKGKIKSNVLNFKYVGFNN